MRRIYYRTVKNNQIRLLGRILVNRNLNNSELDGKRFCFIPYADLSSDSGFNHNGLTALWGTEAYSKALNKEPMEVIKKLADESDKILSPDGYLGWYLWEDIKGIL